MLVTSAISTPALCASWARARFSSSRVMANQRSRGISFALFIAIRQFVLHGFPITSTRTSAAAFLSMAWPCPMKILPLIPSRSFRSIPALRGMLPTSTAHLMSRNPPPRSAVGTSDRAERIGNFNQLQGKLLVASEHFPGGDAKNERVTNLSGCAGDSNLKRRLHFRLSTLNVQLSTFLEPHYLTHPRLLIRAIFLAR